MQNQWTIYALGSAFFAGLTAVLAKVAVVNISSNMATFIRTIVIVLFLIVWLTVRAEWNVSLNLNSKSFVFLILSGLTTGLSWLLYFRALQIGKTSDVVSIDKLSLPIAVVLAVVMLGEHLGVKQVLGVILMVMGALLIAFK